MKQLDLKNYAFSDEENVSSPSLVYYYDTAEENIKKVIAIAGGVDRLWPHVKTHKMYNMVELQVKYGITRFKCATITEAEMVANAGGKDILLAYPLVGPNIDRYVELQSKYPAVQFWALGDDYNSLKLLSVSAKQAGITIPVLIDVNLGMNRTGIEAGDAAVNLCAQVAQLENLDFRGLHCYDGHVHDHDFPERLEAIRHNYNNIIADVEQLKAKGISVDIIIAGGTPSFPCYAELDKTFYYSPGTVFVNDYNYFTWFEELDMVPAAAILGRVISNPKKGFFTLDVGNKAIAADPQGIRGVIVEYPDAEPQFQSEEHWVFKMSAEENVPEPGTIVHVVPAHICPTSALYPYAKIVKGGKLVEKWDVTARNRE